MRMGSTVVRVALAAVLSTAQAEGAPNPHPTARFVVDRPDLPATRLFLGRPVEDVVVGAEVDRYVFRLAAGQFAAVEVRQTGGDLAAALFGPDGTLVDLADRSRAGGVESLTVVARKPGLYAVQIAMFAWDQPRAAYAVRLKLRERAGERPAAAADQLMRAWYEADAPGAAVAVVRRGDVIFTRTIGLANVESWTAISPATRFDLASVSKQFTGYGVALLAAGGVVRLDDDVRKYIPELPDYGEPIMLRQLVDHTSGLRDWDAPFGLMGYGPDTPVPLDRIVATATRQRALNFPPGSAEGYSNTNYALLAEVIARATKSPYETWMRENVFAPAGMTAVANARSGAVIERRANSYRGRAPATLVSATAGAMGGSSSVQASLHDLVAWTIGGGRGGDAVQALVETRGALDDGSRTDYAFGRWFGERGGVKSVGHLGLFAGYRISYRRFPDRDLAVIYLANDGDDATYVRAERIENLFLGRAEEPVAAPEDDYSPPARTALSASAKRDYAGVYYSDELETTYVVRTGADGLDIAHAVNGRRPLVPAGEDRFGTDWPFMTLVEFERRNGAVTGFRVSTEAARGMPFRKVDAGRP